MVSKSYTINSADTWEYKTISIPADTAGVINNDNGTGLQLDWPLNSGSDRTSGSLQPNWAAYDLSNINPSNLGLGGAVNDYFAITGVQLEVGDVATPFEHRSYGEELALCQRYYQTASEAYQTIGSNTHLAFHRYINSGSYYVAPYQFPVEMRSGPTTTLVNAKAHLPGLVIEAIPSGNFTTYNPTNKGVMLRIQTTTVNTGVYQCWIDRDNVSNRAYIEFDSEL